MDSNKTVLLEDFFDFDVIKPINRVAYTKEDLDYKLKIINKMQELGMDISVDKAGNILGSISIGNNPNKTLAIGSHTDSVYNGGQFDGPVGVVVGLQVVENLLKGSSYSGKILVPIYACEESSRFGHACVGSKYLNGTLKAEDFENIIDKKDNTTSLSQAISYSIEYLNENVPDIKEVDKIFENVDYSLEAHIEQYESLIKEFYGQKAIGIITSIGSAVRIKYDVIGNLGHTGSTPMNSRKNAVDATAYIGNKIRKLGKEYEKNGLGRASQVEINTPGHNGSFNQLSEKAEGLIDFRLLGKNTPENVLHDFNKILKKAEKKTRTSINPEVISKGHPVVTDLALNSGLASVCEKNYISYTNMPSWAGQDTSYVPANQKTMIFIPSVGGSHNENESTKKMYIEAATELFTEFSKSLLIQKFRDNYLVSDYRLPLLETSKNTSLDDPQKSSDTQR